MNIARVILEKAMEMCAQGFELAARNVGLLLVDRITSS